MSINKAENSLENRLVNQVAKHERDIREMKSAIQPIGGDSLAIQSTSILLGGPVNLVSGAWATMNITITPATQTLTLWNFLFTLYVDATDAAHAYPGGSALTASQRELDVQPWIDWGDSSDTTNVRVYKVRLQNLDGINAHNYYIRFKAYYPALTGTAAA